MATKFLRHSDELYHSFKQQTTEGGELYHYGRKGMKWGEHIYGSIGEDFLLEQIGRKYREKKSKEEKEREERESQLKYTDGKIWTQDKEKLAAGKAQREERLRQAEIGLGVSAGKYVVKKTTGKDVSKDIDNAISLNNRVKAGHAHYNAQQNSKNEQAGMNKMYAEQDRQRQQRKREELVKSANRNVKEKRYNEKIGMNKVREEQARQKKMREQHMSELAKHARANSYANKMNAKSGMEKARAEQERQAMEPRAVQERRNRKQSNNVRYVNATNADMSTFGRRASEWQRERERATKAHNTAVNQAGAERSGREAALAEQERQAIERRNRKRLSSAVSRNAQYYNKRPKRRSVGYLPGKTKKI